MGVIKSKKNYILPYVAGIALFVIACALQQTDAGRADAPDEGSYYSENQWRIIATDFVAGNDGTAYFRGVSMRYYGDITVISACDILITGGEGDLYRYVTIEEIFHL